MGIYWAPEFEFLIFNRAFGVEFQTIGFHAKGLEINPWWYKFTWVIFSSTHNFARFCI